MLVLALVPVIMLTVAAIYDFIAYRSAAGRPPLSEISKDERWEAWWHAKHNS